MKTIKLNCVICKKEFIGNGQKEVCSHECHLERRRLWHKKNAEKVRAKDRGKYHHGGKDYFKRYEKTENGFLMRKYRNMKSRINGIQKAKFYLYQGKELLPKEDFYKGAKLSKTFHKLFINWKESGYQRKLSPSVDRVDSTKGYTLDNMEGVTMSENSRRGSIHRDKLYNHKI